MNLYPRATCQQIEYNYRYVVLQSCTKFLGVIGPSTAPNQLCLENQRLPGLKKLIHPYP